ncbi:MAG: DUF2441 domain-containing protein [Clostridia bacterium]
MKVKDLILYQVATDRNYKVGDILTFNKDIPNGQSNRVFNTDFRLNGGRPSDEMYYVAKRKFKKFKSKEDIYSISHILEYYDVTVKEMAIEEVRKEYFPNLPSRLHCMYLSLTKDIALRNLKSMAESREKNGKNFQAVAVKLNGTIFKAGKVYMSREGQSYNYYKEKAVSYWKKKVLKDEEVKEVLFEGTAEIVEILKEYNNEK